ncbi:hypothetical protein ACEQ8H_002826 [Pleosporales sp. CAS-2024a]
MPPKHHPVASDYELLLPRHSLDDKEQEANIHADRRSPSWLSTLRITDLFDRAVYAHYVTPRRRKRSVLRLVYWSIFSIPYFLVFLVLFVAVFFPSYTVRPPHYNLLRQRALESDAPGRANPYQEKVFITAALYEEKGNLASGAWGKAVLQLIDLLGPEHVHLSIYEDNPDLETKQALVEFRDKVPSNSTIVSEELHLAQLPHTKLPNGEERLKRIAFLAQVRNRALEPIDKHGVKFDKVLFLNDVIFDPIDAVQLLFATNIDSNGRANYAGACAVDFINPFKFYDRFATVGFNTELTGIPFFPWFTNALGATSRQDVLAGTDAVRVRSCWGGMVAYEARWFQQHSALDQPAIQPASVKPNTTAYNDYLRNSPLRFRYANATFWESSECCLINADLQYRETGKALPSENRIFMNPYIRVAYDERTLSWLSITRRPERLYSWVHDILNQIVGMPSAAARNHEEVGDVVTDKWWQYDDPVRGFASNATNEDYSGYWKEVTRIAEPGGWCGGNNLLVINEKPEHGEGKWSKIWPPHPPAH